MKINNVHSDDLGNLSIDCFWSRGRRPSLHDIAILIDQELLEVPLRKDYDMRQRKQC